MVQEMRVDYREVVRISQDIADAQGNSEVRHEVRGIAHSVRSARMAESVAARRAGTSAATRAPVQTRS
jgi:hypothetical protein